MIALILCWKLPCLLEGKLSKARTELLSRAFSEEWFDDCHRFFHHVEVAVGNCDDNSHQCFPCYIVAYCTFLLKIFVQHFILEDCDLTTRSLCRLWILSITTCEIKIDKITRYGLTPLEPLPRWVVDYLYLHRLAFSLIRVPILIHVLF